VSLDDPRTQRERAEHQMIDYGTRMRRARDAALNATLEALTIGPDDVLVIRYSKNAPPIDLANELITRRVARTVIMVGPDETLEAVDEKAMREAGWVRAASVGAEAQ
jgi:hypothetical protein